MEKSAANSMSPSDIVISEHHDRLSSSSSSSWNSSPASLALRPQVQAEPQRNIEFGEFELPPPLSPRPRPNQRQNLKLSATSGLQRDLSSSHLSHLGQCRGLCHTSLPTAQIAVELWASPTLLQIPLKPTLEQRTWEEIFKH